VLNENRPVSDFLAARFTFLNERLAKHYGIEEISRARVPARVELTMDQRGGILSHASVLTVSSYPTRTSPVIRASIAPERAGSAAPATRPTLPPLDEEAVGSKGSLRRNWKSHRSNAVCAS